MRTAIALSLCLAAPLAAFAEPLPSWNPTATEAAIIDFVGRVTDPASPDFVPEEERIAVFDNDGTLWSEQPMLFPGPLRPATAEGEGCGRSLDPDQRHAEGGGRRRHGGRDGRRREGPRRSSTSRTRA